MGHRKLMSDTAAGLARGMWLMSLAAMTLEGSIGSINAVTREYVILIAYSAAAIYLFAHALIMEE